MKIGRTPKIRSEKLWKGFHADLQIGIDGSWSWAHTVSTHQGNRDRS